jgi:hypothetical protein
LAIVVLPSFIHRLPAQRPAACTFATAERETDDPHDRNHDGRNPQQVNGKPRAEEY